MDTYNGFEPGEVRAHNLKAKAKDDGHSIVKWSTTRRGHAFAFNYRAWCECGKTFGSKQSTERVLYAYYAHRRQEGLS